jgi:hypothetical protein
MDPAIRRIVRLLVDLLVAGNYDQVETLTNGMRLDASSINSAIARYGRTLVSPPEDAYDELDIVPIYDGSRWSIRMALWTTEEGRSDLSIELTVSRADGKYMVEIDDIRVL